MKLNKDGLDLLTEYFASLTDPRIDRTKKHDMMTIIFIIIFGLGCGVRSWIGFHDLAVLNQDWLKCFIDLESVPSKDTIARFMRAVDPVRINECFMNWVQAAVRSLRGNIIPIDGKTIRSAFDACKEKTGLHLVTAWNAQLGLSLGQVQTPERSNETSAIPILLDMLNIEGAIITIDAAGCQKKIAKKIIEKKGDYFLALKGNQPETLSAVKSLLEEQYAQREAFGSQCFFEESPEYGHGRIENRRAFQLPVALIPQDLSEWSGLQSVIMVESERHDPRSKTFTTERRYYLSSRPVNAREALEAIRAHWGIESMHWQLDVTYHEDFSTIRAGNAAANLNILTKFVLSALRREGKALKLSGPRMQRYFAHPSQIALREKVLFGQPLSAQ
ncbi:MAG: ISAs1 family transposase [Mailhella sp.]|nr:ISAs1 family transposase [Mailhella sp.]